jgi:hypothetical protein
MVAPCGNLSIALWEHGCSLRSNLNLFFPLGIIFHPLCSWMKNIICEKVQTQYLWAIRGILTIALVFIL